MRYLLCIAAFWSSILCHALTTDSLWNEFVSPSDSTKTKVWWFRGQTESTDYGTTADLEAYKKAGIGGVVYYDQVHGKGDGASDVFSTDWWRELIYSAKEAKRLGLTFEVNISNGYVAGGPWITPRLGMQHIVTTDTIIEGGKVFDHILSKPKGQKDFWDFALIAFPEPIENDREKTVIPKITSNINTLNADSIFSRNGKLVNIPIQKNGKSVYITMYYPKPFTAQCLTYAMNSRGKAANCTMNVPGHHSKDFFGAGFTKLPNIGELEVSEDNINYKKVCEITPLYQSMSPISNQQTIAFKKVTGHYYRINLHDWSDNAGGYSQLRIGNVSLSPKNMIDHWQMKSGINPDFIDSTATQCGSMNIINPYRIMNLTDNMDSNGHLTWKVPKGKWHIMRFGYAPTGSKIKHGRNGMSGLECDKMSKEAAIMQFNNYFATIYDSLQKKDCEPIGMIMDSHEGGPQNWTPGFEREFLVRRGYDIHKYLPALMGYTVGSGTESERFLYDFRRTIADLISDHYYAILDSLCRNKDITLTAQAVGNALNIDGDNIQAKGRVAKPQGEFWAYQTNGGYDIKEAASAAHLYGKPIASAEAFTDAKYSNTLEELKHIADYAYTTGINEFVVCASAYQPWKDRIPGNTAGGREYCLNRNNTYWKYSSPFWDYQSRCAGLLRKGKPIVDLCVFIGDDAPVKLLANRLPEIPEGYNFDVATTDALQQMSIDHHDIKMPEGMKYKMIVIDGSTYISKKALSKIDEMVRNGAILYANKKDCISYAMKYGIDQAYQECVDSLWGTDEHSENIHTYGKGKVYQNISLAEVLADAGISPDIRLKSGNEPNDKVYFNHRVMEGDDIYFVYNHSKNSFKQNILLRTTNNYVELWNPVNITNRHIEARNEDEKLRLDLSLQPEEAVFLITSDRKEYKEDVDMPIKNEIEHPIEGPWKVYFDKTKGGASDKSFNDLTDWGKSDNDSIRFYSGEAVYMKSIKIKENIIGRKIILHFDTICSLARVIVNGKYVTTLWCSPWEADITPYITRGSNKLKISVINSLTNRMIGDANLPKEKRYTYSTTDTAKPNDRLQPSGIIGNVSYIIK